VGFAWNIGGDRPTVIRGGAGTYYDTQLGWWRLGERAVIGGSGRQFIGNAAVINPLTGQPFSPAYLNSLQYTYGMFLQQMPALRAQQDAKYPGTGDDPQILLSKQATALGALYPHDFPTTKAHHFNLGFQRELGGNLALQADVVYRKMLNGTPGGFFGTSVDYNRFNAIGGPVIRCARPRTPTTRRRSVRRARSISLRAAGRQSIRDIAQNLNDYFATSGPDMPRHNLTVSGVFDIPWGLQVSVLSTYMSAPPVAPTIAGVDNTGTNTTTGATTPLLTLLDRGYADFLSNEELASLVDDYNARIAGTLTPAGAAGVVPNQRYPTIRLPASYSLGDPFSSQDVRVTKTFRIGGRTDLRLIGEVFNVFNVSNLTNYNFNLSVPGTFGQPNQRVGQTFGSGGPRAGQFAVRVSF